MARNTDARLIGPLTERFAALADAPTVDGRPSAEVAAQLKDELLFQRATQAYLWALPLISTLGMKLGSEKVFGAGYHVLPIWKDRLDAKTLVTTPNSDLIYAMSCVDLGKDGPLFFEAPPGLQGILLDFWQRPIPGPTIYGRAFAGDVGLPGPDAGKGGKFLLLPPGFNRDVPSGYYVYRSGTNSVFVFLRAFYDDPNNLVPTVRVVEKTRIYPFGGEATAHAMTFPNASGVPTNILPISDGSAFDALKQLLDSEGDHLAEPDSLGLLASIGIVKDKPFTPDEKMRTILECAARTGYTMSRVVGFEEALRGCSLRIYTDRRWVNPMDNLTPKDASKTLDLSWINVAGNYLDLDARSWFFTNYYSISPGMLSKTPGKGAAYMIAFSDSDGAPLSGGAEYRLSLPGPIPAANFWSVTLYEAESASGLANGQPFPSLGSRDMPASEADGGTDIYLGPMSPAGKQGNWLATVPGRGFFAILRLYGPTEDAINHTWKPGDFVRVR
jgi:hypothetical protein